MERPGRHSAGSGVIHFSDTVLECIDDALNVLLQDSNAKCALVIDRTGCVLANAGDFHPVSEDNMGAVAAGVIAALNTMMSRATSPEVSIKFYGSDVDKVHFMVVADRFVLCMLHGRNTTTGQVRSAGKAFIKTVMPVIEKERASETHSENLVKSVKYIENKLNDMFKDFT